MASITFWGSEVNPDLPIIFLKNHFHYSHVRKERKKESEKERKRRKERGNFQMV